MGKLAERVGFEPTVRLTRTTVFETASLNRSDISPRLFMLPRHPGFVKPVPVSALTPFSSFGP